MANIFKRISVAYNKLVLHPKSSVFALYAGLCGGLVAIAVDFDHITMFFGHPSGRVAHAPLFILACFVGSYCLACFGGLVLGMVLKRDRDRYMRSLGYEPVERIVKCDRPNCPTCGGKEK